VNLVLFLFIITCVEFLIFLHDAKDNDNKEEDEDERTIHNSK
jgi:hypothetical protein